MRQRAANGRGCGIGSNRRVRDGESDYLYGHLKHTTILKKAQAMATTAGVWIDHEQAIVVLIMDAGQEIKKFKSSGEQPARPAGGSRSKNKYTPNDFIAEDKRERKLVGNRKKVFEEVLACIRDAASLLILGPGEAKGEFSKYIKAKKLGGLTVELETTDKMTDRQLVAKVSQHFAKTPAGKSAAPKKAVK
jgi:stalled ribosome rescue protein Dom34